MLAGICTSLAISVTPLAGVWVEICAFNDYYKKYLVTPLAGVWVEMTQSQSIDLLPDCHSPCGSVG